jgi:hypothetical protein
MAKVVDPDNLALAVNTGATTEEVEIQTDAKTIEVNITNGVDDDSPGSTSGVTLQCLYSFLKEEWKTNATLNKFKFPIKAIYEAKFVMQFGWSWQGQQTRDVLRDAGWIEIDGREEACIISLGAQFDTTQQGAQQDVTGFDQNTTDFDKTGPLNEAVTIVGTGGSPDTTTYRKIFLRVWERTYSDYNILTEQGFAALTYIAYRAPLANADDIKNDGSVTQGFIDGANEPYNQMDLQYYPGSLYEQADDTTGGASGDGNYVIDEVVLDGDSPARWAICTTAGSLTDDTQPYASFGGTSVWVAYQGERQIGTPYYAFNRCVQYNGGGTLPTKEQIYLYVQNALTKATDINTDPETETYGTVNGEVAVRLSYWVGDNLHSWPGVHFDDYHANDTNAITLEDITVDGGGLDVEDVPILSTERVHPFAAAGNIVFSQNLVDETDADTQFRMYHKYIATQVGQTDFTIGGVTGANATLTGTGMTLSVGEYFTLAGFTTNVENNGVKVATGTPTATDVDYTDALGVTQVADVTGEAVTLEEQPFDTASAITVTDNGASPIEGLITVVNEGFDFAYDTNTDGGRTPATPAPIVIVAQGLPGAEWVFAEFTITRAAGLSFPVNAPDELTYLNP